MRPRLIMAVAAFCGAGTFLWSLAAAPHERPPRWQGTPGAAIGAMAVRWPRDLGGLTEWVKQNPGEYAAWFDLAELRRNAGDASGEREAWERVAEGAISRVGEPPVPAEGLRALFMLGWSSDKLDRAEDARIAYYKLAELCKGRADDPMLSQSPRFWHRYGWALRRLGREPDSMRALEKSVELLRSRGGPDRPLMLARNLVLLGRTDEAIELLDGESPGMDRAALEHDEILQPLHDDARFAGIAAKAGTAPRVFMGG
jgi:hypothetical protein